MICNTSALQYLHQLGQLDLLRQLYGRVTVPQAVAAETAAGKTQGVDLPELAAVPWITVRPVTGSAVAPGDLGEGELAVLALAATHPAAVAVLDDGLARRYARLAGVRVTGTCGILRRAKQRCLVPKIEPLLSRLTDLGFRLGAGTRAAVLELAGESE